MQGLEPEKAKATRARLTQMTVSVLAFAAGCTLGALLYAWLSVLCCGYRRRWLSVRS